MKLVQVAYLTEVHFMVYLLGDTVNVIIGHRESDENGNNSG